MTLVATPSALDPSLYISDLKPKRRDSVLTEMVGLAHRAGSVRDPGPLIELLFLRERLGSTAIGKGVAIPNARSLVVLRPQIVFARSRRGVEWSAPDQQPVSLVLLVLAPAEWSESTAHAFLGRAVAVARLQRNRQRLLEASSFEVAAQVLKEIGA
jgi:fructose PTS system EIIBC or EIIC component